MFTVFLIIISVSLLCFFIFQLWYIYENRDYIIEFNNNYKKFEFVKSTNFNFKTSSVYDPNVSVTDVKMKIRCVEDNKIIYALNKFGFVSNSSLVLNKTWSDLDSCITDIFTTPEYIIFNPCDQEDREKCELLRRLMG